MFLSLVGVALVAPFFAVALIVGARAVALAESTQDDVLLMALAFGGAIASMVNGLGLGTTKAKRKHQLSAETNMQAQAVDASVIGLGY
jgi:cytochrome c biogenesis protein CcdA